MLLPRLALCVALLAVALPAAAAGPVCAGCPMPQDDPGQFAPVAKAAFGKIKEANPGVVLGNFARVVDASTQVVAGTFFTFTLRSNTDEVISCKVFRSLPDAARKVTFEVSTASMVSSPVHHDGNKGNDLVIAPGREDSEAAPLETMGATWSEAI